jgi:hypothetical protein
MCHHWKGDTWHGMTSATYMKDDVSIVRQVTWHMTGPYGKADVADDKAVRLPTW